MKKVLAFVLTLAMVLGCFASVFAAEYTDVKADDDFATAVSVLADLGVVSGYPDGTYQPTKVVTRAEMASLIVKALGLTPSGTTTTKFTDVKSTDWFAGWVAYANSLGIIAGRSETIFDPTAPVSYDEAIVMLINALGYSGSLTGTYPTAFIIKAQSLGITKDVELLGSTGANRGDIAQLIYNTLGCGIGTTNKDGEFNLNNIGTASAPKDDTMYARLGAEFTDAVLVTPAMVKAEDFDLSEYLGAEAILVKADGDVVGVKEVKTEWLTGKLTNDTLTKIGSTVVLNGAFTTASAIYKNGAAEGTGMPTVNKTYKFAVKYNDDNDIKTVVSAQYWDGTTTKVTADVKATETKIATEGGTVSLPTRKANGKDVLDTDKFELVGVDSIADIKKDNIITVYKVGSDVVKVEVGANTITGKATKIKGTTVTINGTAYELADGYTLDDAVFTVEYTFFLDFAGQIFFAKAAEDVTSTEYAVLLDSQKTNTGWTSSTDSWQVKLFTAEGKTEIYDVDSDFAMSDFDADTDLDQVVKVTFDDDNVVTSMVSTYKVGSGTTGEINAKGAIDGKYIASDAVIFTYEKDDEGVITWSVLEPAKAVSLKLTDAKTVLDTETNKISLLVGATNAADSDAVKGIYAGSSKISSTKFEATFMVDGKEVTYTTTKEFTFDGTWGKIIFSGEAPQTVTTAAISKDADITADATLVSGTYTTDGYDYALDADIMVYVVDKAEETVTVGSTADLLDADNNDYVVLYDIESTPDEVFEVAVVFVQ